MYKICTKLQENISLKLNIFISAIKVFEMTISVEIFLFIINIFYYFKKIDKYLAFKFSAQYIGELQPIHPS